MTGLTGVGVVFSASHRDAVRRELHGHSYEVTAWWPADPPRDAVMLQALLRGVVSGFEHKVLPDDLNRAEDIAAAILRMLGGCVCVEVNRPVEKLYARASEE